MERFPSSQARQDLDRTPPKFTLSELPLPPIRVILGASYGRDGKQPEEFSPPGCCSLGKRDGDCHPTHPSGTAFPMWVGLLSRSTTSLGAASDMHAVDRQPSGV